MCHKIIKITIVVMVLLLVACKEESYFSDIVTEVESSHSVSSEEMDRYLKEYVGNYNAITVISLIENYGDLLEGNRLGVMVIITKEKIHYEITSNLANYNGKYYTLEKEMNTQTWNSLIEIMKKYELENWQTSQEYLDSFSGDWRPSGYMKNETIEYNREGCFFNLDPVANFERMDPNEYKFRTSYQGSFGAGSEPEPYQFQSSGAGYYYQYGVPFNYNEFRKEFWDLVIKYTSGIDWRDNLDQAGEEVMLKMYPELIQKDE